MRLHVPLERILPREALPVEFATVILAFVRVLVGMHGQLVASKIFRKFESHATSGTNVFSVVGGGT